MRVLCLKKLNENVLTEFVDYNMEEMWEDVVGYEGHYQVSNSGKVFSLKSGIELKPNVVRSGYKMVRLNKNGWARDYLVHRLVADAFCNNPENKPIVNHIDGIKTNNYFLNLEWVTNSENQLHAHRLGLRSVKKRTHHPMAKLSEQNIKDIRLKYAVGFTYKQIASEYNIHFSTVGRIIQQKLWKESK